MNKKSIDTKYSVKLYELRNMVFNRSCFLHVLSKNYRLWPKAVLIEHCGFRHRLSSCDFQFYKRPELLYEAE